MLEIIVFTCHFSVDKNYHFMRSTFKNQWVAFSVNGPTCCIYSIYSSFPSFTQAFNQIPVSFSLTPLFWLLSYLPFWLSAPFDSDFSQSHLILYLCTQVALPGNSKVPLIAIQVCTLTLLSKPHLPVTGVWDWSTKINPRFPRIPMAFLSIPKSL